MLLIATLFMASCDKDGNLVYLSALDTPELIATTSEVQISTENYNMQVLSLSWNTTEPLSSDSNNVAVGGLVTSCLQVSTSSEFTTYSESTVTSKSKSYTGGELNALAKTIGLTADVSSPMYFRIKATQGANMSPKYSETRIVNVTPITIDMSYVNLYSSDKSSIIGRLYSPASDGVYKGLLKATSWMNFWAIENDGTTWGNVGLSGHEFEMSNASDAWNFWFPGQAGHYYVTIDTEKAEWTAELIKTMTAGDVSMTYDAANSCWAAVVTTTEANQSFAFTAAVKLYNTTTDTSDDAAVDETFYFAPSGDASAATGSLSFASASTGVTIATPGEYTITLTINDEGGYDYAVTEGSSSGEEEETPLPSELKMCSTDGTNTYATLTTTGDGVYTCEYVSAGGWENFLFIDEENGIWYGCDSSDNSKLSAEDGKWNCWFSDGGNAHTYTIEVNLNTLSWSYTIIGE